MLPSILRSIMCLAARLDKRYAPRKLVLSTRSKSAASASRKGARPEIPALFTRISIRPPSFPSASAKPPRTEAGSDTSITTKRTPLALEFEGGGKAEFRLSQAAESRASSRPVTQTQAPLSKNARAIANPIPFVPPVTNAVFPRNSSLCSTGMYTGSFFFSIRAARRHVLRTPRYIRLSMYLPPYRTHNPRPHVPVKPERQHKRAAQHKRERTHRA